MPEKAKHLFGEAALSPLRFDGGRLGGTPRPTMGSDRSVASLKGRDKRGLSRRSRGDRPTGAFCSAVS